MVFRTTIACGDFSIRMGVGWRIPWLVSSVIPSFAFDTAEFEKEGDWRVAFDEARFVAWLDPVDGW